MQEYFLKVEALTALPKEVVRVLIKLSSLFRVLCSNVVKVEEFGCLDAEFALNLCELEIIFPPSIFLLIVHLSIHLAYVVRIEEDVF